jgi:hypothetical protein
MPMEGSPSRKEGERGNDLVSSAVFRGFAPSAWQVGASNQNAFHFAHGLAAFRVARLFG